MSKREELADAIAVLLNAPSNNFSKNFTAVRRLAPFVNPSELDTIKVSVFTGTKSAERRTRSDFGHTYKPFVAIQRKLDGDEATRKTQADEAQTLVEEIEQLFEDLEDSVAGLVFLGFDESDAEREAYDIAHMQANVFSAAISLEFQD